MPTIMSASSSNPDFQPFGYAGGLTDYDTDLIRFGARDYDPSIGRWTSKEPLGFGGALNWYVYCDNDPVNKVDPLGLVEMCHRGFSPVEVPYARHCYLKFEDGTTKGFDNTGTGPDVDPDKEGTQCSEPIEPEKDECIKDAMDNCKGENYHFTKFNCCNCAEEAMKECGVTLPADEWPNWPINPGPQPGEPGYTPLPVYIP